MVAMVDEDDLHVAVAEHGRERLLRVGGGHGREAERVRQALRRRVEPGHDLVAPGRVGAHHHDTAHRFDRLVVGHRGSRVSISVGGCKAFSTGLRRTPTCAMRHGRAGSPAKLNGNSPRAVKNSGKMRVDAANARRLPCLEPLASFRTSPPDLFKPVRPSTNLIRRRASRNGHGRRRCRRTRRFQG